MACSPGDIANGLLHAADDHPCCKATLHAAANLLANIESPDRDYAQPLRRAYSREELASAMAEWMMNTFGHPLNDINDSERLDRWYRDNGMLYQFICAHFPSENANVEARRDGAPPPEKTSTPLPRTSC
jgi:hypothetical protein